MIDHLRLERGRDYRWRQEKNGGCVVLDAENSEWWEVENDGRIEWIVLASALEIDLDKSRKKMDPLSGFALKGSWGWNCWIASWRESVVLREGEGERAGRNEKKGRKFEK